MRRLVVLFVVALVGATVFGLSGASQGVSANGATVSATTLRHELSVIRTSSVIQCYLTGLDSVDYGAAGGGDSIAAAGAAAWTKLRVEGLAITKYATTYLGYRATASRLATAETSLKSELTEAASSSECPGTAAEALSAMPATMRQSLIDGQASSLYLVSRLNTTVPLTSASAQSYYDSHAADFDTLCISLALVEPTQVSAFAAAQAAGASVAELAKEFSQDPSKSKGGAYGCYSPSSADFASVSSDVGTTALNTFPVKPLYIDYNGTEFALYVAPTKRTVTPFAQAEAAVLTALREANATAADAVEEKILYAADIAVDPAFGQWGLSTTSGPSVFALSTPRAADVNSAAALTAANTTPYQ